MICRIADFGLVQPDRAAFQNQGLGAREEPDACVEWVVGRRLKSVCVLDGVVLGFGATEVP